MAQTCAASGLERATPASIDSPDMRRASRDMLSLALIDARNHTLHLLSLFEQALAPTCRWRPRPTSCRPLWLAGHVGWFAEWWIARNTQRAFGNDCPSRPTRLASIDPQADDWWSPQMAVAQRGPAGRCRACPTWRKPSPTCSRRWRARWNCSSTRPRPMPACTSTAWRCSTKTCAASSSW
jgi:hypothetical protein